MNSAEAKRLYPNSFHAVAYCEIFVGPSALGEEDAWPILRKIGPDEAMATLKASINMEGGKPLSPECASIVLIEMDTDDFRNYFKAKMGML